MSAQRSLAGGSPDVVYTVPAVKPLRALRLPRVEDRTLGNGLRVLVARRPGVPRVELRLVVPTARGDAGHPAGRRLLARTILSGTDRRSSVAIAEDLQALGGGLDAAAGSDELVLSGSTLSSTLAPFLEVLADVLTGAAYPADEVALQRDRLVQDLAIAASQPETVARDALVRRLFGRHPYGQGLPSPDAVKRLGPGALRRLHAERLRPGGAILVVVGDVSPRRALDQVEAALGGWAAGGEEPGLAPPEPARPRRTLVVHRPGSVQTTVRIGGPAAGRGDPDYPRLALANLVFGGYFTSRLVDNIREDKGYTYSPGSSVQQFRQAAYLVVQADVGTSVTAPALVEMRYELARMVTGPFTGAELTAAKRYLAGTLSMAIQTQAGLAAYLATLAAHGLPVEYLRDYPRDVERLGGDDVLDAARRYLHPDRLHTVLVGDADAITEEVSVLDAVEVASAG